MNAVTRTLTPRMVIGRSFNISLPIPKLQVFALLFVVLITSLSVVYAKDLNRRLFIDYQTASQVSTELNVTHSKLLLEASSLSAQARVQRIAAQRLSMQMPTASNIKVIDG